MSADATFLADRTLYLLLQGILVLPLAGFVVLALFGEGIKRDGEEKGAGWLACGTVLGAFALAVIAGIRLVSLTGGMSSWLHSELHSIDGYYPLHGVLPRLEFDFIEVGALRIPMAFLLDPLSLVMTLVVTGVGSLIHIYSRRLHGSRRGSREVLLVPEPLHVLHARARSRCQPAAPLRGMGGSGALLVPAHRLLVPQGQRVGGGPQGIHRQSHW